MHTYGGVETASAGLSAYSLTLQKPNSGATSTLGLLKSGDTSGALYQLKESIPFIGKDPAMATNRGTFTAGAIGFAGGRIARKIVPALHRIKIKVGRHTAVSIA